MAEVGQLLRVTEEKAEDEEEGAGRKEGERKYVHRLNWIALPACQGRWNCVETQAVIRRGRSVFRQYFVCYLCL